ncbi:MAG: ribonuclease P protein component [Planctomycetota bacterium]
MTQAPPSKRYRYPRRFRLTGRRQFSAVFDHRVRRSAGPLTVSARPNGLDHNRVGLSVPRRVGNAVARNRVKRLIREAIRLNQHDLPAGYDLVISVRPHDPPLTLDACADLLATALRRVDRHHRSPPGTGR